MPPQVSIVGSPEYGAPLTPWLQHTAWRGSLLSGTRLFPPDLEKDRLGCILPQHRVSTDTILSFLISQAFKKTFFTFLLPTLLRSAEMLLTFWLQTSPFHSSSWKPHSIHYLCQAPCAVLAGRLYFEASMWHILNVMLQLSHAEIYLGCLKSDFARVQNYITS